MNSMIGQSAQFYEWATAEIAQAIEDGFFHYADMRVSIPIPKELGCRYRMLRVYRSNAWLSNGEFETLRNVQPFKNEVRLGADGKPPRIDDLEMNGIKEYTINEELRKDSCTSRQYLDTVTATSKIIKPFKLIDMSLLPLTNLRDLQDVRYLEGRPRVLRFDASRGTIRTKDDQVICRPDQILKLIPVAFRMFTDRLFDYKEPMQWLELFFLNERSQVTSILFHGFSVQEFSTMIEDLWYDQINLTDVTLIVSFVERTNKEQQSKYHIARFGYQELKKAEKAKIVKVMKGTQVYRKDTISDNIPKLELSENYDTDRAQQYANSLQLAEGNTQPV